MTTMALDLYLDLLKKSLTNTLYAIEPDTNQENEMDWCMNSSSTTSRVLPFPCCR